MAETATPRWLFEFRRQVDADHSAAKVSNDFTVVAEGVTTGQVVGVDRDVDSQHAITPSGRRQQAGELLADEVVRLVPQHDSTAFGEQRCDLLWGANNVTRDRWIYAALVQDFLG